MIEQIKQEGLIPRPPVVVVLGHVDSGKTSILDAIRKTKVAQGESGGITQHIGAYQIEVGHPLSRKATEGQRKITFIDTPGHEAFSQMRLRGAKVADIAIIVIDSMRGVQPQTKEAITIIKKAEIPLIVALNKIDRPEANPEKIKRDLMKEDILVESLAGKIPSVEVSAATGKGIDELLDLILLIAEMENLVALPSKQAKGLIIESHLDSQTGPRASMILEEGTLGPGLYLATNSTLGKIKSLENFLGKQIEKALPADPVTVIGFENPPLVGEEALSFSSLEEAESFLQAKKEAAAENVETPAARQETLENETEQKILNLILKADYSGSLEAVREVLKNIPQDKVSVNFVVFSAGDIDEADVKLAKASGAKVIGFRVKTSPLAQRLAERNKISVKNFEVIYDLVESVRKQMEGALGQEITRRDLGKIKILALFFDEKNRQVLGGRILEGEIEKGGKIEVFRQEQLVGKGRLINLQKNKKDVETCPKGEECGILYEGDVKVEKDDVLLAYKEERTAGEL